MNYFKKFVSNTYAAAGNQHFFNMPENERKISRVFYKITCGGMYNYSLLFSNIIDSTFANGAISHKNLICNSWTIHSARVGICKNSAMKKDIKQDEVANEINSNVSFLADLTFASKPTKVVAPGEFFSSDEVLLSFGADDYLCLELEFSGKMLPYHEESLLPIYSKIGDTWVYDRKMPLASMIGCDRKVKAKIGYLGDSITQGCGTPYNEYKHWSAFAGQMLGCEYAHWNLGLGYGRANDIASDGAWLYKAKQNDIIILCCGVNDISQGFAEEQIKKDITTIVDTLKELGKTVILQTVPPYNFTEAKGEKWFAVNDYIKTELVNKVDYVFEVAPHLCVDAQNLNMTRFNGHPNPEGCAVWAKQLYKKINKII